MVKSIGFVYLLEVFEKKGDPVQKFTIDLKNGKGGIFKGKKGKPDATITLSDVDAVEMFSGKASHIDAFMKGKIKIKGNMQAATKFTPEVFMKPKL
jgi:putative sterol carrier protein